MGFKSIAVPLPGTNHSLHIWKGTPSRRITGRVVLLHGAISNGKVYYPKKGSSLADYLVESGKEVFVADFRGQGRSTPRLNTGVTWRQNQAIDEDIPALLRASRENSSDAAAGTPLHIVTHSWGGVLAQSYLARYSKEELGVQTTPGAEASGKDEMMGDVPEADRIASLTHFSTKRKIHQRNWQYFLAVKLMWKNLFPMTASVMGYVPSKRLGFGEDTSGGYTGDSGQWACGGPWVDVVTGFDYLQAIQELAAADPNLLPGCLWLAAENDPYLGNRNDVRIFAEESESLRLPTGSTTSFEGKFGNREELESVLRALEGQEGRPRGVDYTAVMGKSTGFRQVYTHTSILTDAAAAADHFGYVDRWIDLNSRPQLPLE